MNTAEHFEFFVVALAWAVVFLLPVLALAAIVCYVITKPFRSLEQARFLLDIIETGLKDGKKPEQAITEVARQHECALGARFRLLAARLKEGLSLTQALDKVPRLLPPQITAMLKVGVEIGDLGKILPAARKALHDDLAQLRYAQYADITLATTTSAALILILQVLGALVFPKVRIVLAELDAGLGVLNPILIDSIAANLWLWTALQVVFIVTLIAWGLVYLGGTERIVWVQLRFPRLAARIWHGLPWRHKRLQRDFSFLLAVLLDAHVPEEKAVAMAAAGTASADFKRRGGEVVQDLREGLWLPSAIRHIDEQAELQWRLQNAIYHRDGFLPALAGWHDWLECRALQQEKIAINATQLAMIVYNGVMVALVAASVFQILITILDLTAPW